MERIFPKELAKRWSQPKGLIQVFTGPRQVGKTTTALRLMNPTVTVYASADLPTPPSIDFIVEHWHKARNFPSPERTLILDEVQKIPRWSEVVKKMWDEDQKNRFPLKVCLLGSSAILLEKGLSESLTGRFEVSYFPHWTFAECQRCFGVSLQQYLLVGGYPKAYDLRDDPERLINYIQDSIVEPTLGRDILALHAVDKPALLRQLFWYVSRLPSQIVSFEKILGHLQGRGNSATLVHYAELLSTAFMVVPIGKFSKRSHRTKRSMPKWIFPNPALIDVSAKKVGLSGFVFENLVGAHLLNLIFGKKNYELHYWREGQREIDFVLTDAHEPLIALEVKSGRVKMVRSQKHLKDSGLGCKFVVITNENITDFMQTTSVEGILKIV